MLDALKLDCERERTRLVNFIREQAGQAGRKHLVVNLSGGVDSALVLALCVQAVGTENVHAMFLPYETSNPESKAHACLMADSLGIPCEHLDITPMLRPLLECYPDMDARRKGNIMARCRMIIAFDASARYGGLMVGTSNRTETLLGYFTLHGDGAADLKPIAHLYKCQVRALAQHVGVPQAIIDKAPSADLWEGQTDEGELGFTYDEADCILYLLTERHLSEAEVAAQGFDPKVVAAVGRRLQATAFKRQPPPMPLC